VRLSNIAIAIVLMSTSFVGLIPTMSSEETEIVEVEVLFDFGNGVVNWAQVTLDTNHNALNATKRAGDQLNIDIVVIWTIWGGFVSEIDGLFSSDYGWFWGFFVWNHTENAWESSSVGASALELDDGDVIGWAPVWDYMNPTIPMTTPYAKYPWPSFQSNGYHTGTSGSLGPETNSVEWIFDTGTKELAASPVLDKDGVIVNNWGGTFYLDYSGEIIWKNSQVQGVFTPTIAYDKVLVGGKDGFLYALNLTNGEVLWKTKITDNPGASGVTSPPTVVIGKVYLGSYDFKGGSGLLFCLDESTGKILWKNTTQSSVYFSSPAVYQDNVYVGTMGRYNSSNLQWEAPYGLYCFDAITGEPLWNYPVEGSVGSSPTIMDQKVLFTSKDGFLYCLDSEIGTLVWKKEIGSSVSSPAIAGDSIFVGSGEMNGNGKFYSLDFNGDIKWEYVPNGAVQGSSAVAGDHVYFATNVKEGTVYCLNNSNGNLVWEFRPWPNEYIISSPAVVEGRLYIASDNGRLYCFGGESPSIDVGQNAPKQMTHVGEDVNFVHNSQNNVLTITKIEGDLVNFQIESVDEVFKVRLDKTVKIDTDSDGKKDMIVQVSDISSDAQTAYVTLDVYNEPEEEIDGRILTVMILVFALVLIFIIVGILKNVGSKK
jgi:outer membrane protein assembly factor BamB